MNAREQGFALLTCYLGNPERKPLTVAQLRRLAQTVQQSTPENLTGELEQKDLLALGYDRAMADRILDLLSQQEQLQWYIRKGKAAGCVPITRVSEAYPPVLRRRLGLDAPGCLWAKGDLSLLEKPAISVVGSRRLNLLNEVFAQEAGRQAALQGYVLISGNARGADRAAQESCLEHGGSVISVVADELEKWPERERVLYLSEDGFDLGFSAQRALSRNRVIHGLPRLTLVAQCTLGKGGSWDGSVKNLKHRWSPVFVLDDGSEASNALQELGAEPIIGSWLVDISGIKPLIQPMIDQ